MLFVYKCLYHSPTDSSKQDSKKIQKIGGADGQFDCSCFFSLKGQQITLTEEASRVNTMDQTPPKASLKPNKVESRHILWNPLNIPHVWAPPRVFPLLSSITLLGSRFTQTHLRDSYFLRIRGFRDTVLTFLRLKMGKGQTCLESTVDAFTQDTRLKWQFLAGTKSTLGEGQPTLVACSLLENQKVKVRAHSK